MNQEKATENCPEQKQIMLKTRTETKKTKKEKNMKKLQLKIASLKLATGEYKRRQSNRHASML